MTQLETTLQNYFIQIYGLTCIILGFILGWIWKKIHFRIKNHSDKEFIGNW